MDNRSMELLCFVTLATTDNCWFNGVKRVLLLVHEIAMGTNVHSGSRPGLELICAQIHGTLPPVVLLLYSYACKPMSVHFTINNTDFLGPSYYLLRCHVNT